MSFFGSQAFTLFHVALSLAGIVTGLVVVRGLIRNEALNASCPP